MTKKEIGELQALKLAFVGDAVHTLFVRETLLQQLEGNLSLLSKSCNSFCNAAAQEKAYFKFLEIATEEEKQIAMRGRNASLHHAAKNFSIETYRHATAYEAVVGYLYLLKDKQRLNQILMLSKEGN